MPYIDVNISKKLSEQEKDILKAKLGELIAIIPGKSESVLMVGINDGITLYFGGQKKEKIAYLNVKMYKEAEFQYKAEFTRKVFEFLEKDFGFNAGDIFMNFEEHSCWGANGVLKNE